MLKLNARDRSVVQSQRSKKEQSVRRAVWESLEDRQLMSLTVDLRVAGSGAHSAQVTSVGQTINLVAWATVTGSTAGSNDYFSSIAGSFLTTKNGGGVAGNLTANATPDYQANGFQNGTSQDLNGDGSLDVGSNNNGDISGFFNARGAYPQNDGDVSGNSQQFAVATLSFTVTSLGSGGSSNVQFRLRDIAGSAYGAIWEEDHAAKNDETGTFGAGLPFTITSTGSTASTGGIAGSVTKIVQGIGSNQSGVSVYVDKNNDGILDGGDVSTTTNSTGGYSFTGLSAGNYSVREILPSGFTCTSPAYPAAVTGGATTNGFAFHNFATAGTTSVGTLTGTVDKVVGGTTSVQSGVTVFIDSDNSGSLTSGDASTTTNSSGGYLFAGVTTGSYTIREVTPSGFTLTSPASGYYTATINNNSTTTGTTFVNTANSTTTTTGSLSGLVNKVAGGSTSGFSGVTVYVDKDNSGTLTSGDVSTSTNSSGGYIFTNLSTGSYAIREVLPSGYTLTSPSAGYYTATVTANTTSTVSTFVDTAATTTGTQLNGSVIGTGGSYNNDGNTISKAVDGNLGTYFDSPSASGSWVGLDVGTGAAVTTIKFAPRPGYASRMVGGVFQASNAADFSSGVVNLYTVNSTPSDGSLTTVSVSASGYRYFRYLSPSNSYGNVAEVQFFGTAGSSTATKLSGSVFGTSGSYNNDGNTISKAIDGSFSSFFDGPTANGNVVGLNFGAADTISQIRYAPRPSFESRMVGGTFQASNTADFSSGVVNLYTISSTPTAGGFTTVSVSASGHYQYVRYVSPAGSYGDVAEIEFDGTPGTTTTYTKFSGTAIGTSGSYNNDGNTIAKAFDGSTSTFFDAPSANGAWVGLDLGTAKVVKQVKFAPRAGFESRMVGGTIQASSTADFSSGVVTLGTITSQPASGTLTTLSLTNSTAYRYYRYLSPNGAYGDIAELEFDG